ncbi:MAG: sulfotransferase [Sphingomonadales bacterium]|nr:sulfotransferase [Sphingomonadales bacterium]NCP50521.1 sulfotransferase [Sphingomonadales bacterium]
MTQLIIIIGAARSGTKYLRDILATAPNAEKVPYDINYIWRYGTEEHPNDAMPASLVTSKKAEFIKSNIHRLAGAKPTDNKVIFEKSVSSGLRIPFIDAVLPDAKYIHLIRDGRAVTESAMRLWQEPPNWSNLVEKFRGIPLQNIGYAFWFFTNLVGGVTSGRGGGKIWGPRYPGIDKDIAARRGLVEICAEQWRATVAHALEGLESIPQDRKITIRFEELVSGTDKLLEICKFCDLDQPDTVLDAHRTRVDITADDKWKNTLPSDQMAKMSTVIDSMLQQLGYSESGKPK